MKFIFGQRGTRILRLQGCDIEASSSQSSSSDISPDFGGQSHDSQVLPFGKYSLIQCICTHKTVKPAWSRERRIKIGRERDVTILHSFLFLFEWKHNYNRCVPCKLYYIWRRKLATKTENCIEIGGHHIKIRRRLHKSSISVWYAIDHDWPYYNQRYPLKYVWIWLQPLVQISQRHSCFDDII